MTKTTELEDMKLKNIELSDRILKLEDNIKTVKKDIIQEFYNDLCSLLFKIKRKDGNITQFDLKCIDVDKDRKNASYWGIRQVDIDKLSKKYDVY